MYIACLVVRVRCCSRSFTTHHDVFPHDHACFPHRIPLLGRTRRAHTSQSRLFLYSYDGRPSLALSPTGTEVLKDRAHKHHSKRHQAYASDFNAAEVAANAAAPKEEIKLQSALKFNGESATDRSTTHCSGGISRRNCRAAASSSLVPSRMRSSPTLAASTRSRRR